MLYDISLTILDITNNCSMSQYVHTYIVLKHHFNNIINHNILAWYKSRLTIVSREAKKKQAVCDEEVFYLHVALL